MASESDDGAYGLEVADEKVGWVYRLRQTDIRAELESRGLVSTGKLSELRARLVDHLRTAVTETTNIQDQSNVTLGPVRPTQPQEDKDLQALDIIRKWGIHYDGSRDPIEFLESVNELKDCYNIQNKHLVQTLPIILKGNNKNQWTGWTDFIRDIKTFFNRDNNLQQLEDIIRNRRQQTHESFKEFLLDIHQKTQRFFRNPNHR